MEENNQNTPKTLLTNPRDVSNTLNTIFKIFAHDEARKKNVVEMSKAILEGHTHLTKMEQWNFISEVSKLMESDIHQRRVFEWMKEGFSIANENQQLDQIIERAQAQETKGTTPATEGDEKNQTFYDNKNRNEETEDQEWERIDQNLSSYRQPKTPSKFERMRAVKEIEDHHSEISDIEEFATLPLDQTQSRRFGNVKPPQVKLPTWNPDTPDCTIEDHFKALVDHIPACRPADEIALTIDSLEGDAKHIYRAAVYQARRVSKDLEKVIIYAREKTCQVFSIVSIYGADKKLRTATQGDKSLRAYYIELHKLYQEAVANGNQYSEKWLASHFANGLTDRAIGNAIVFQQPKDIFEAYALAAEGVRDLSAGTKEQDQELPKNTGDTTEDIFVLAQSVYPYIDDSAAEQIATICRRHPTLPFESCARVAAHRQRSKRCWTCGKEGHYSYDCYKNKEESANAYQASRREQDRRFGQRIRKHLKGRFNRKGGKTGKINNLEDLFEEEDVIQNFADLLLDDTDDEEPKQETLKMLLFSEQDHDHYTINKVNDGESNTFRGHRSKSPLSLLTVANVGNRVIKTLFDTGASVCAISHQAVQRLRIPILPTRRTVVTGVDGVTQSLGRAIFEISFHGAEGPKHIISALVLPGITSADVILSDEFMRQQRAMLIMEPEGSRLLLDDQEVPIRAKFRATKALNVISGARPAPAENSYDDCNIM